MKNQALRIQDSIYGIVELNKCERDVIDSHSFQRLLSVKQLGFAYAVFPGADYSRFSHCIGACHVMKRLLLALETYAGHEIENPEIYCLAALLHDVGHYPFSHTTEHAIERRYRADLTQQVATIPFLDHEEVGGTLLSIDKNLREAIDEAGFSPAAVSRVFANKDPSRLTGLISSDIDADRLDYLLRTAHHTGLPYGHIDQNYLVREVRVDRDHRLCWTERSLSALDHVLLGRSYDYQQVAHNKTVVALELLLQDIVYALTDPALGNDSLDLSKAGVEKMIASGEWYAFDDHMLFEKIKSSQHLSTNDSGFGEKCVALIDREPPRRVAEVAALAPADLEIEYDKIYREIEDQWLLEFAAAYGIDRSLWWVWGQKRPYTSYKGMSFPVDDDETAAKLTRILAPDGASTLAVNNPQSVVGRLCTTWRFVIRIYVLIPRDDARRDSICASAGGRLEKRWAEATS